MTIPYTDVRNLDFWKDWLKNWVNSGQYNKDIQANLKPAYNYVYNAIGDSNAVVIFDMDETMISEYSLMLKYDFGWTEQSIDESQLTTNFPAIIPTQDFYNYCLEKGMKVIILTSKRQKHLESVLQELTFSNYQSPAQLILRPDDDSGTIAEYKANMRRNLIENYGCRIICNVGDQPSDFYQGYAENNIKIPNLFYDISIEMSNEYKK